MIFVVSSQPRDISALAGVCESRGWSVRRCDSIRSTQRRLRRERPRTIVMRHALADGYSDQVLALLATLGRIGHTRTIVLVEAGTPPELEARQITLGADTVLRDPLRIEVLLAYLARYQHAPPLRPRPRAPAGAHLLDFAGGRLHRTSRTFHRGRRAIQLTPRETELVELLAGGAGEVVTYEILFAEILGRLFHGDTSNMRVLLGKLTRSLARLGIRARDWIAVIPKSGYRYRKPAATRR